jgi:hypothetical protein
MIPVKNDVTFFYDTGFFVAFSSSTEEPVVNVLWAYACLLDSTKVRLPSVLSRNLSELEKLFICNESGSCNSVTVDAGIIRLI